MFQLCFLQKASFSSLIRKIIENLLIADFQFLSENVIVLKINIIHMGFFYSGGGERVALEQARLLRERGHTVRVFSPIIRWDKSFPELLADVGPDRIVPPLPLPFPCREASAMIASAIIPFRLSEIADCDVLLCHSQPSMFLGYRSNFLFGTPYVGYLHQLTTFIHRRPEMAGNWASDASFHLLNVLLGNFGKYIARQIDRICHINASRLLFNSRWTKKQFENEYGATGDICYPAIKTILPSTKSMRTDTIVIASRHYPWKRIDLAFNILKRLKTKIPDLMVTGEMTGHTLTLKKIVKKLELVNKVHFTGHVDDETLSNIYSSAKAYLQTSIYEPFGMSTLEAQNLGTPAVVWGDAGTKETVIDGETGFHAKPYDLDDFSFKLDTLLKDKVLWRHMSRNAKIWASSFNWDSHINLLEAVLDEESK